MSLKPARRVGRRRACSVAVIATTLSRLGAVGSHAAVLMVFTALLQQSTVLIAAPHPPRDCTSNATEASPAASELTEAREKPLKETNRSFRSGPPDTTPYTRPIVPEDLAPRGEPAIPPGITVPAPDDSPHKRTNGDSDKGRIR